jgi:hypothetical protein
MSVREIDPYTWKTDSKKVAYREELIRFPPGRRRATIRLHERATNHRNRIINSDYTSILPNCRTCFELVRIQGQPGAVRPALPAFAF